LSHNARGDQESEYLRLSKPKKPPVSWWKRLFGEREKPDNGEQLLAKLQKAISAAGSYIRVAPFGKPVFTDWKADVAIRDGFKASNWVYACVKRLSDAASMVPWSVQERRGNGEWKTVPGHPLEILIENPNPFMSRQDMFERMTQHLNLAGNALLHKVQVKGTTVELWPINPDTLKPIPNEKNWLAGYQFFKGTNEDVIVKPDKIIHAMFSDPANPYWGMSPLQAVGKIVDTELDAISWWKVSLQNRCVKDGIISFKRPLSIDQWTQAREAVQEQISGTSNARGPIIVGEDVDYQPFAMTPAELDFINSRKMTRSDILGVFCVPPPLVGILDKATYANVQEARKIFWIDTIMPYMESLRAAMNRSLIPEFGEPTKLRLALDFSSIDVFMNIIADRAEAAERYFRMGVPLDTITRVLDLAIPKTPTGQVSFVPANMLPYGTNSKEAQIRINLVDTATPIVDNNTVGAVEDTPLEPDNVPIDPPKPEDKPKK
jgi:HK97 family phage portal protein